jgi:hypothetical protein
MIYSSQNIYKGIINCIYSLENKITSVFYIHWVYVYKKWIKKYKIVQEKYKIIQEKYKIIQEK